MIQLILEQVGMMLPLVLGAYFTISLMKLPDFALESAYLMGAIAAYCIPMSSSLAVLGAAAVGGMVVGGGVCVLHQRMKLPFLLASILMNGFVHGMAQWILGTSMVRFHPALDLGPLALSGYVGILCTVLMGGVTHSQLGYSITIYGTNPLFFQHHPVSGQYVLYVGVMLAHGCAGMSGFLFAYANGFVDVTMQAGIVLLCLTALILGKFCIPTSRPQILVPILGILGYCSIQYFLLSLGLNLKYFNAFQAVFILMILGMRKKQQSSLVHQLGV